MNKLYLGIDIGGTNIKTALIDSNNHEIGFNSMPTDKEAVIKTAKKSSVALISECGIDPEDIVSIGVGIPGIIEGPHGPVVYTPNLPLDGKDIAAELASSFRENGFTFSPEKIILENDANCAGLAESELGAGQEYNSLLLLTLGTGLGGTVIFDGKPLALGKYGGEIGHIPFLFGGRECSCGLPGCLEKYTNSQAFKDFGIDRYTTYLGAAIAGFVNIFRPEIVVLAGGVTNAGAALFDAVNKKMAELVYARDYIKPPRVIRTALGNDAGAVGAALAGKLCNR